MVTMDSRSLPTAKGWVCWNILHSLLFHVSIYAHSLSFMYPSIIYKSTLFSVPYIRRYIKPILINPSIVGPYVGEFAWYQIVFICCILIVNPYTYFLSYSSSSVGNPMWIICELVLLELSIGLKLYVNMSRSRKVYLEIQEKQVLFEIYQIPQSNPFNVAILNHRLHV